MINNIANGDIQGSKEFTDDPYLQTLELLQRAKKVEEKKTKLDKTL
jgi:hypothetical protein